MILLIIGNKGTGKTKRLIELVNSTAETSKGNVICIEKGPKLSYNINYKVRLVNTDTYGINGDNYYGFLCGICAGNYDITDIFADATFKILGRDIDALTDFLTKVSVLSEETMTNFTFTISCEEKDLPDAVFSNAKQI